MRSLGYSFFFITGLTSLVAATPYPQFAPLVEENDNRPLDVRAQPQVCNAVNAVVSVLKINKATPFCSSFLGIKTFTAQDSSTEFVAATITVTSTISQTTTTTVQTDTITHTETTTVATLPTVVETIVVPEASISTFTSTPPSATITVTVYTTPGAARVKRDAASHEDRAIQLPPYVKVFGSSAVSKACSCLSLPTPTVTSTNIVTQTTTETADALVTAVDLVSVTATTDLTITQSVTSFVPTTAYTTSVTVSVTTVTAPTPTFTQTVTKSYNSHCVNILSGGKIFTTVSPNRSLTYPFATTPLNGNGGEETFSQCCQLCYESADCAFYYAYPQSPGNWRCQIITTTSLIDQNVSPTCPKGLVPGATYSGSSNQFIAGSTRGIGPCYVLANQLP